MKQQVKISKVKGNPSNPRIIKNDKFKKLVKSIQEFPEMLKLRPIVVDEDFMVLGGNMRLKASKEAGLKEVWIEIAEGLTEEQKKEFIVKDNVGFGEWEWDILANEWDSVQLAEWGLDVWENEDDKIAEAGLIEDDEIPEVKESIVKRGDIWQLGEHRVMCGDSTSSDDVEKLMNGEKADMVFTDPPYNIDYQGVKDKREKIKNDKMSDEDFTQFLTNSLNVDTDTFYVCCSWQYSHLFRKALENLNKPVKSFIVWNKVNPAQHLDKYFKQHEIILYHGKFGGQKTLRGDVWEVKRERNTVHPTMKPISLIEIALLDNKDKKLIYDAFLGSGSTLIAAEKLNRKCYGMELDEKYCDVIINRWEQFTGLKAKKI
tara:strand:+ start:213 stop:1331 length:1119 start_codon:yes stop_codon:yes gene_type:complete